jgi:hypothetical protein
MRIIFEEAYSDPQTREWIRNAFLKMQTNKSHNFGLLYNAWTESNFGAIFKDHFTDCLETVQADSGGLQVITQGKVITEELKNGVYQNQSKYSKMAMSFDEIPLSFSGEKSSRLDLSNRWFDTNKFEDCAKLTGRNIFKQIKTFIKNESISKPIFIIQGNCYDTYMKWTELALKEIPKEFHSHIGGVAMGAAALGHGTLEDIQRAFIYTQLPIDITHKHMHLLAVGSVSRMLPNLIFMQTGLYNNMHLTYDSTTHTSGMHMCRYYHNNKTFEFGRHFSHRHYNLMYEDVKSMFDINMSLEEFHEALNSPSIPYKEKYGTRCPVIIAFVGATLKSIDNFKTHVDLCLSSKEELLKFAGKKKDVNLFNTLYQIKDKSDFDSWMQHVGKHVKSLAVASSAPATLEGF